MPSYSCDVVITCCCSSDITCALAVEGHCNDRALAAYNGPHSIGDDLVQLPPAGLALLGPIEEKFVEVTDLFVPKDDGTKDRAYISRGERCICCL